MKISKLLTGFAIVTVMVLTVVPMTYAASTNTNVTIAQGPLTISPVTIESFGQVTLSGQDQTADATINDFTVTDARGNAKGWSVQVSATRFANGTSLLHDGALTLSGTNGAAVGHSDKFEQSYINNALTVTTVPSNYVVVPVSKGKGTFSFSGGKLTLELWPSEVIEGTYTSTVTIDTVANIS
ncbi:WxL domain-containing protein [Acetanaerobacterium elongatum]|uniref:WxL domain surface cell wall-binding n=1 Tax=Acetanaerobacterium elongatum TaxID=258515 RepID=A0A1H0GU53_9FIRM|nr:WxL domain-containing protein [Acetanaerobacterium elongatum]SDO10417.1 WxL domain surface cell wall-binding [Acetanaerobacterium elongatum]